MRIYIIDNDGITLCGEPPAVVNEGEMASHQTPVRVTCTNRAPVLTPIGTLKTGPCSGCSRSNPIPVAKNRLRDLRGFRVISSGKTLRS